jgi:putative transposase
MKRARLLETQIVNIFKEAEAGVEAAELCRQNGFSRSDFYKWKSKYGGLPPYHFARKQPWLVYFLLGLIMGPLQQSRISIHDLSRHKNIGCSHPKCRYLENNPIYV